MSNWKDLIRKEFNPREVENRLIGQGAIKPEDRASGHEIERIIPIIDKLHPEMELALKSMQDLKIPLSSEFANSREGLIQARLINQLNLALMSIEAIKGN